MILHINTKDQRQVVVSLKKDGKIVDSLDAKNEYGSQVLLPLIEKILKKNKMEYKDIDGLEVETGPGSFTGIRVGVSVANALGYTLGIPVNGKNIETEMQY
ncbi:tRNA (adenosine(37)-N6)-threonylcarbamoyltransferase complex dimerization subunit type 1 TsaB [Candidatus Daviesbacteria bacterium RIFCSPHIGHO2_12_FULL_37_11]|uniref:tRNA (Adenosine(37)-N6)-threonylcarbamoyltransferase complex dimerization subunit type 1 TsaB n=1 Tax=Candidatus Daviesbacteria bacterium RIFCSPHIGHO2_12_FULL_37_11 TaxID=1797777 RepID=A0A1F5KCY8_9BACT|nr:MAG: tRNA (adenosine(37)-N6)-threonylcarbamoyltransferase complex dimerization subunit type 1 TsaB [Candidatus Daviesbacteria bacterium GWA1_38_6]OGE15834.1 MAG: tRNA (adenosine(37)-N6)-threonylcarbamoyltransferase complex dimerization subunit type 1 TsaB [Candidatus Daviesbacteria bacterium RIFCSPHIGHO2_01_FULL_37_27]OGE38758.1 MAG: tRNA (adenosine(37)-N6)-threonylcarbamoyltransferase complex dimerization subunit type 1 TsaB [Candidatus Daviesbacteria bacterium RIFCSPHIGHO2_12_FULL_37_11]OGE